MEQPSGLLHFSGYADIAGEIEDAEKADTDLASKKSPEISDNTVHGNEEHNAGNPKQQPDAVDKERYCCFAKTIHHADQR